MLTGCCKWFQESLNRAGEEGYSIAALKFQDMRIFLLLVHFYERELIESSEKYTIPGFQLRNGAPRPLTLATHLMLEFCPVCGRDLKSIIEKDTQEFDLLADRHKKWCSFLS
jgi:hypothetical protein